VVEFRGLRSSAKNVLSSKMPACWRASAALCPVCHVLASSRPATLCWAWRFPRRLSVAPPDQFRPDPASHALSFFHLSAPDLLLDLTRPAQRNVLGWPSATGHGAAAALRCAIRARVIELLGGKVFILRGDAGRRVESIDGRARIRDCGWIPEALSSVQMALGRMKAIIDQSPRR
jgi:NAD-reducing hydrogenase large subunit